MKKIYVCVIPSLVPLGWKPTAAVVQISQVKSSQAKQGQARWNEVQGKGGGGASLLPTYGDKEND